MKLNNLLNSCVVLLLFINIQRTTSLEHIKVDVKAHPEDLRLKRNIDKKAESEIVAPVRMREDLHQPASRHFRSRRSISDDSSASSDEEFRNPVYKINAFGEEMLLRLHPDDKLVAPSYTTSYSWKNQSTINTPFLKKCFYKGVVVGRPSSLASLSLCDGMTGSVYTDDYIYSIAPEQMNKEIPKNFGQSETSIPHSIQRRSVSRSQKRSSSDHGSSCGVNDDRHRRKYLQTYRPNPIEEAASKVARQMNHRAKRSASNDATRGETFETRRNENEARSRRKRSFNSEQYYIETLVVADASMLRHHDDDLEHYILSIMMVANSVFSHPSLGSAIAISVVKIMVVDENEGPRVSTNAAHTLRDFCYWQKQFNVDADSDPEHYDLAILLTKVDLCGDTCDTLGMAEVGAMCSMRRSCAIVEDDGLSASYTVAHEIGHVLNMMHDDNRLCRANFAAIDSRSHVMSSTMERVDSEQPWSLCSKQAVIDFLEDGRGECLRDEPQKPKVYPRGLPGAMYDVNAQCEMSFGKGATECPYMKECSRLWCQLPRGSRPNQCHTKNFPRADGSPCVPGRHCMQGKCVARIPEQDPIDGGWGSWSQYGSCSRTCGGGVRMASRQCNSPAPRHGGKYCTGERLHFRSCNTEACAASRSNRNSKYDFRSEQCASYNGQRFPALGVRFASTWIPKYNDVHRRDRCKLICQSVESGTYVTLSDRVVDGTRCSPDSTDICVHGQCMQAGCDGMLGSNARYNKCGLCINSNKGCKRVVGKYNRRQSGYSDVVTFPKGAASIRVQQKGFRNQIQDGNYLALVDSSGRYLLNGALTLSTVKKDIEVNGTVLQYSGVQVAVEKIHSTMPLKEPIRLQVLSLRFSGKKIVKPKIKYSYFIAKPEVTSSRRSRISGPRSNSDDTTLVVRRKSSPNRQIRRRSHPKTPKSDHSSTTNPQTGEPRWVTGRWAKCKPYRNRNCGSGWRKRKVTCKIGKDKSNRCNSSRKPIEREFCFVPTCPTATPILRPRSISSRRNDGPSKVNRYIFHNEQPIWNAGMWGSCSTSCGLGVKRRIVMCQTRSSLLLSDSMCDPKRKPPKVHGCNLRDCR